VLALAAPRAFCGGNLRKALRQKVCSSASARNQAAAIDDDRRQKCPFELIALTARQRVHRGVGSCGGAREAFTRSGTGTAPVCWCLGVVSPRPGALESNADGGAALGIQISFGRR